jgi:hypothetical protein
MSDTHAFQFSVITRSLRPFPCTKMASILRHSERHQLSAYIGVSRP